MQLFHNFVEREGSFNGGKIAWMSGSTKIQQITQNTPATHSSIGTRFLGTVLVTFFGAVGIMAYIVVRIPPSLISIIVVLALTGFIANASFALVCYKTGKCSPFETSRQLFRRKFKVGIIVGVVIIALLVLQRTLGVL